MRKPSFAIVLLTLLCGPAFAADPIGEWLVADGSARIRVEPCGNALWGIISWTREPGFDSENPDPAKRNRSIVGVPILRNMKQTNPNKWEGEVYNAKNGKMYSANIMLNGDDVLKIEGCVLGGIFCGGEKWARVPPVKEPPQAAVPKPRGEKPAPALAKPKEAAPKPKDSAAVARDVCYE
jgi:uncharacterized protein (DUF2147 family)